MSTGKCWGKGARITTSVTSDLASALEVCKRICAIHIDVYYNHLHSQCWGVPYTPFGLLWHSSTLLYSHCHTQLTTQYFKRYCTVPCKQLSTETTTAKLRNKKETDGLACIHHQYKSSAHNNWTMSNITPKQCAK